MNPKGIAKTLTVSILATLLSIFPGGKQGSAFASTNPSLLVFNDQVCDLAISGYLGDGTVEDPFQISDSDSLWEVTDCSITNSAPAHFDLVNDIDVSQAVHAPTASPIGFSDSATLYTFSGVLDGKGFTIGGIDMVSRNSGVGLFALLDDASFRELRLEGIFDSSDNSSPGPHTGALAMTSYGTLNLENVVSAASVTGYRYVGGLVGRAESSTVITSSWNVGPVSGSQYVGGLIGYQNSPITLHNSGNSGTVTGNIDETGGLLGRAADRLEISHSSNSGEVVGVEYVGGLVGRALTFAYIDHSQNSATISGTSDYVGGLIGHSQGDTSATSSSNIGAVSGSRDVGGLFGNTNSRRDDSGSTIAFSMNHGNVSGTDRVGGLVGKSFAEISVNSSTNSAVVSGQTNVGGLVGFANGAATISFSLNIGGVSGSQYVGGLLGWSETTSGIYNSENFATVSASGLNSNAGGILGYARGSAKQINSWNHSAVTGLSYVGGLIGYAASSVEILSSINQGPISGSDNVGGLIGSMQSSVNVSDSSNLASVRANRYAGGLLGWANRTAEISTSYNQGPVTATEVVGGLIGQVRDTATISASFNTGDVSAPRGNSTEVGGLIGVASYALRIDNSFNSGQIEARDDVGGLVGDANLPLVIRTSYNAGAVSGSSDVDGIAIHPGGQPELTFLLSTVASVHVGTTPVNMMRTAEAFAGFDLDTIWGFGACTENDGLPMLRYANQVSNYYASGCYTAPAQESPILGSTQPKFPSFDKTLLSGLPGQAILATGENFGLVISARISGIAVSVELIGDESMFLTFPSLEPGIYSLEMQTVNGRITYQTLIQIQDQKLGSFQALKTLTLTMINEKSSWITKKHLAQTEKFAEANLGLVCVSYAHKSGLIARKKALSRALHACRAAERQGVKTRVFVYGKAPKLGNTVKLFTHLQ